MLQELVISVYDADAAWMEETDSVADRIHGDEMLNDAALILIGYVARGRDVEWYGNSFALFRISDAARREVTLRGTAEVIGALRETSVRVFHHDVISCTVPGGPAARFTP